MRRSGFVDRSLHSTHRTPHALRPPLLFYLFPVLRVTEEERAVAESQRIQLEKEEARTRETLEKLTKLQVK